MPSFRTAILGLVATASTCTAMTSPEAFLTERVEKDWTQTAKRACALVGATDFDACVSKVVATSDLGRARDFRPSHPHPSEPDVYQDKALLGMARQACADIIARNYELCIEDVMDSGDLRIVDNFPKKATTSRPRMLRGDTDRDDDQDDELLRHARDACATVHSPDRHLCVQDVLATRDVGLADLWPKADNNARDEREPDDRLLDQAKQACRAVKEADRLLCVEDVLFTRDLNIAASWPKETRRRRLNDKKLLKEAKEACQYVKAADRELCIEDVLMTGDVGIADIWPKSLPKPYGPTKQNHRQLGDKKLLKEAKEACQYVKAADRELCIEDVLMTGDVGIADIWPKSLPRPYRRRLGEDKLLKQAKEACRHVKAADRQLCIDDVLMTGDVGIAGIWPKSIPAN